MVVNDEERTRLKAVKPAALLKVVRYLERELGLNVYGAYIDIHTGTEHPALRDWGAEDIVRLRQLRLRSHDKRRKGVRP